MNFGTVRPLIMGDNSLAVKACLFLFCLDFLLSPCLFTWLPFAAAGSSFPLLPGCLLPPSGLLPPRHGNGRRNTGKQHCELEKETATKNHLADNPSRSLGGWIFVYFLVFPPFSLPNLLRPTAVGLSWQRKLNHHHHHRRHHHHHHPHLHHHAWVWCAGSLLWRSKPALAVKACLLWRSKPALAVKTCLSCWHQPCCHHDMMRKRAKEHMMRKRATTYDVWLSTSKPPFG